MYEEKYNKFLDTLCFRHMISYNSANTSFVFKESYRLKLHHHTQRICACNVSSVGVQILERQTKPQQTFRDD